MATPKQTAGKQQLHFPFFALLQFKFVHRAFVIKRAVNLFFELPENRAQKQLIVVLIENALIMNMN